MASSPARVTTTTRSREKNIGAFYDMNGFKYRVFYKLDSNGKLIVGQDGRYETERTSEVIYDRYGRPVRDLKLAGKRYFQGKEVSIERAVIAKEEPKHEAPTRSAGDQELKEVRIESKPKASLGNVGAFFDYQGNKYRCKYKLDQDGNIIIGKDGTYELDGPAQAVYYPGTRNQVRHPEQASKYFYQRKELPSAQVYLLSKGQKHTGEKTEAGSAPKREVTTASRKCLSGDELSGDELSGDESIVRDIVAPAGPSTDPQAEIAN